MKVFTENILGRLRRKGKRNSVQTLQAQVAVISQPEPQKKKTFWEKVQSGLSWLWDNGGKIIAAIGAVVSLVKGILFIKEKLSEAKA
jgi:peroxiredoxin